MPNSVPYADIPEATKQRNREAVRRAKDAKLRFVADYKAAEGCRDCGEDDPVVLDMHHRDRGAKHHNLHTRGAGFGKLTWPDLREELAKCDVLCSNCHRRHHHKEKTCQA